MEHTSKLRKVEEGDEVSITTSDGKHFDARCQSVDKEHADPRTGEVRTTTLWKFDAVEYRPVASIIDGLRSSPDDPTFPEHNQMWDMDGKENMGYIEELTIHGRNP